MLNWVGIFVSGMYLASLCELTIAVGAIVVDVCKEIWSIYTYIMLAV